MEENKSYFATQLETMKHIILTTSHIFNFDFFTFKIKIKRGSGSE